MAQRYLLVCFCLLFSLKTYADDGDTLRFKIKHEARSKNKDLSDLEISVNKADSLAINPDSSGFFMITGLKPGKYDVSVKGPGFRETMYKLNTQSVKKNDTVQIVLTPVWVYKPTVTLLFAQNAFSPYWQSGGINSISMRTGVKQSLNMKYGRSDWNTDLDLVYGFIKQGQNELLKNEDRIDLTSKYGLKVSKRWLFSALLNFRTSFNESYVINKDGTKGNLVSDFMAPGFLNVGTGFDFKEGKWLSIYYSPMNLKFTSVQDSSLRSKYLPVADQDKPYRLELGSYLNIRVKQEIMKNVMLESKADFFTNHLQNFGSIDVNWENIMAFKVNKYLTATVLSNLVYDEDILFTIVDDAGNPERTSDGVLTGRKGPRTQFHQSLNIGLTHTF